MSLDVSDIVLIVARILFALAGIGSLVALWVALIAIAQGSK